MVEELSPYLSIRVSEYFMNNYYLMEIYLMRKLTDYNKKNKI